MGEMLKTVTDCITSASQKGRLYIVVATGVVERYTQLRLDPRLVEEGYLVLSWRRPGLVEGDVEMKVLLVPYD